MSPLRRTPGRSAAPQRTPGAPLISAVLDRLLTREREITVGELFQQVEERGFGLLMVALGIPMLIPILPPGSSTVVGTLYGLLGIQLVTGMERPWLPAWIRRRVLSTRVMDALRRRGVDLVRRLESYSRPRFHVLNHPASLRLVGVVILLLGIILASPAPFMNLLPTFALMLVGIGILNDDGVFVLAGTLLGVVLVAIVAAEIGVLIALGGGMLERLRRLWPIR